MTIPTPRLRRRVAASLLTAALGLGAVAATATPAGAWPSKYTKCRFRVARAYWHHGYDIHTHQFDKDVWTLCGDLYKPGDRWQ